MSKRPSAKLLSALILGSIGLAIATFQNCSRANFAQNSDSLASSDGTNGASGVVTTFASTTMNTPVSFAIKHPGVFTNVRLSFQEDAANGSFGVDDADQARVTFTPAYGFRGRQQATAVVTDRYGSTLSFPVVIDVGNGLSSLKPAMAVRGMGCVQCHAQVSSNVITDFGYGGDGRGRDYFFFAPAGLAWNSGSLYGDHGPSMSTMGLASTSTVFVPANATLPAAVPGGGTLASYLRAQFANSGNSGTRAANVQEVGSVYIGAPTDADLTAALKLAPGDRSKYYPNDGDSPAVTGLVDKGGYFKISGNFTCDGDLAVRGPLLIDNLTLTTDQGCRLYVLGSVFAQGPINYTTNAGTENLQITATRVISFGLGSVKNNGAFCEPSSRWDVDANAGYPIPDSFLTRLQAFWTVPSQTTRAVADPNQFAALVVGDKQLVEAGEGTLLDASCRPETRAVSFNHLLIDAPVVVSRYQGDVHGTLIAEYTIMSLQAFKFEYDDVFTRVPVLPFLDPSKYLSVSGQ